MKTNQQQKNIHPEWQQVKIGVVCDISAGGTPSTDVLEYWEGGNIPWANSAEINKKNIYQTENFITDEGFKNSSAKIVPANSVLIALAGQGSTRGKVAVNKISLTTNQSIAFFIPKKDISYSFLRSDLERRYQELRSISAGDGGRGGLNLQILKSIKIKLPPLPEQNRIVSVLETWDKSIEKLSKKIQIKKNIRLALKQNLLSGKKRLSGFGDKWQTLLLKDVCKIYDGTHQTPTYVEHGIPFYSVEHVTSNDFKNTKYISEKVYESEIKKVRIERGDILMTRIGSIGAIKYIDWDVKASFYVTLALLKVNRSFDSKALSFFLTTKDFQNELRAKTLHVAFPIKINLGDIGECKIYLPKDIKEQEAIAKILNTAEDEIQELEKKLQIIKDQKKYLLNNLITGTIRTPDPAK
ncbi:MAG: restriction endonuclease subunit S [Candidatus Pacebacteria bacterium]|jgi:type I restriction enzyme S subunit|nr:restriction endonuclease subunit S [Candidatus Paceibacterota bacterium]